MVWILATAERSIMHVPVPGYVRILLSWDLSSDSDSPPSFSCYVAHLPQVLFTTCSHSVSCPRSSPAHTPVPHQLVSHSVYIPPSLPFIMLSIMSCSHRFPAFSFFFLWSFFSSCLISSNFLIIYQACSTPQPLPVEYVFRSVSQTHIIPTLLVHGNNSKVNVWLWFAVSS